MEPLGGVRPTIEEVRALARNMVPAPVTYQTDAVPDPAEGSSAPSAGESSERRRHARVPLRGRSRLTYGERTLSVQLIDVSEGGLRAALPLPLSLSPADPIESPMILESRGSALWVRLEVTGRVSWLAQVGPERQFGVSFEDLAPIEADKMRRFLALGTRSSA